MTTVEQEPNGINPVNQPLYFVVSSDKVLEPKFRYIFDVTLRNYLSEVQIQHTFYVTPSPSGRGEMDISKICRDFLFPRPERFNGDAMFDYSSDTTILFTRNQSMFMECEVRIGESYAADPALPPDDYIDQHVKVKEVTPGLTRPEDGFHYLPPNGFMEDGESEFLLYDVGNIVDGSALPLGWTGTPKMKTIRIASDDHFSLSFFAAAFEPVTQWPELFRVEIEFESGATDTSDVINWPTTGGSDGTGWDSGIVTFMCGPKDISAATTIFSPSSRPTKDSDWKSYTIYGGNDFNELNTIQMKFERNDGSCQHDYYQLQFRNRFGAYNYQGFSLVPKETISAKGKKFRNQYPERDGSGNIGFNPWKRGLQEFGKIGKRELTLVSNWLLEHEAEALQDYIYSDQVNAYKNGGVIPIPCIVKESKFEIKKRFPGKLIQYTIKVELAQRINEW